MLPAQYLLGLGRISCPADPLPSLGVLGLVVISYHVPVMVTEVLDALCAVPDGVHCDATTGTGGHAEEILRRLSPKGRLVCLDQDPRTLDVARERLGDQGGRVRYHRGSFSNLDVVLRAEGETGFDGVLLDLGLNSWTLSRKDAGLSYQIDVPLDMAVDPDVGETAAGYLARVDEETLTEVFREFGGVRRPGFFARRVLKGRAERPIATTGDLVRAIMGNRPGSVSAGELSRCFQAIRVIVLEERERLETFLQRVPEWIRPGGRLVIISYASHEDRVVKHFQQGCARGQGSAFQPLSKKPLAPGREEIRTNRRARSAKLRAFERGAE